MEEEKLFELLQMKDNFYALFSFLKRCKTLLNKYKVWIIIPAHFFNLPLCKVREHYFGNYKMRTGNIESFSEYFS